LHKTGLRVKDKNTGPYLRQAMICKAFAHPTRLQLLDALTRGERGVSSLQEALQITKTNLSQHLALLKSAGLVVCRRDGRQVHCSLAMPQVKRVTATVREILRLQDSRHRRAQR
jgi:ArsR family transcriptional regulator